MSKYEGQDIKELGKLFFELGNNHLVPALSKHIVEGLKKFQDLQEEYEDLQDMIIIADLERKLFAFAPGDGSDLEDADDENIFYRAKDAEFNDTMELLDFICFGNHPEGYLNMSTEVGHWIGDALRGKAVQSALEEMSVTVYGHYDYSETEDDPFWES